MDVGGSDVVGSRLSALHETVAITDNGRNSHAAQEAELLVAVLDCRIASQITGLLFLIGDQSGVGSRVGKVAGGNIEGKELNFRILLLSFSQSGAEEVAGHDDDLSAVLHSVVHLLHAGSVGVLRGTIVVGVQAVGCAEVLHALPGVLVEGLVIDIAYIGDESDVCLAACGGSGLLSGRSRLSGFFGGLSRLSGLFRGGLA